MNAATMTGMRNLWTAATSTTRFNVTPKGDKFEVTDGGKVVGVVSTMAGAEELISILK